MRYIYFLLALFFTNLEAKNQPNFVLILIDDLGLTDLEAFGGEIDTPNINSLAEKGLMFTNYHTSPECAPSRAMLLTGMDNHKTGIPMIPEVLPRNLRKNKGYEGYLLPEALTIAEVLKKSGYRTYMTGKWHLGFGGEHIPSLPINRGFDKTFILDATGGDNYSNHSYLPYYLEAPWFKNGEEVQLPEDFYSSEFFIDQMIDFIDEDSSKSPFFAYVSFQAQHIPVQAPKEFTEKYLDLYKDGWSALRERRLKRAQELGIFPEDKNTVNSLENYPWEEETQEEKELLIKSMAVFAGMLNAMDFHIGRLIEYLKNNGLYEDTIFIITSDNGPEGNDPRDHATWRAWYETSRWNNNLETLGEEDSYVFIGTEFAQAMASPSHLYKFHMSEGGLRVPLIISGKDIPSGKYKGLTFVTDVAPTIADLASSEKEDQMIGKSLKAVFNDFNTDLYKENEPVGLEVSGNSALFLGDYKIVKNKPPVGDSKWRLFNLKNDPGETQDLQLIEPEIFITLIQKYAEYVEKNGVIELGESYRWYDEMTINTAKRHFMPYIYAGSAFFFMLVVALIYFFRRKL